MSRIFLSHSSADNAAAIALRDWLVAEGWNDLFLDLDPERGIAAGERWERALNEAASRCEAVLSLVSKSWLSSRWCMNELNLARRLNKRLFGVLVDEGIGIADLPHDVTSTWQLVNLATGRDHKQFRVTMPITGEEVHVTFSHEGLARLKTGLQRAGLHANFFSWPPETDPKRSPYRGLRPLEADDAGIFFGREAPIVKAIDQLRGLREAAPPRLFVILGASGAGKSSFLRAGLYPRLQRDDHNFLPLPIIRPERAALSGETGLVAALASVFEATNITTPRAELRAAIQGGATNLKPLLRELAEKAMPIPFEGDAKPKPPTIVLSIDQAEELFFAEAQDEAQTLLVLLRELVIADAPSVIVVFTIRSDNYERLQEARELDGIQKAPFDLGPMPKGSYADVINGPVRRLDGGPRVLRIEPELVQVLLSDIEAGGAKDALPLLAFTLERLYGDFHASGQLTLDHYEQLGRVKGSIEAAVDRAFKAADADPAIPKDRTARLALLRRGLIPWLAGIDPDTGAPRRRVARLSEIPAEARPLVDHLVGQRLLATDVAKDTGEKTIEPAHEALLRQWGLLQGWLAEDSGLLSALDGVKRASRDWAANDKSAAWLNHSGDRLTTAEALRQRPDLSSHLEPTDWAYLISCRGVEIAGARAKRRRHATVIALMAGIIFGLVGWINQAPLKEQLNWWTVMRPYMLSSVRPYVLTPEAEQALMPGQTFRECAKDCPEMVVVPSGEFVMGSPLGEAGRSANEGPRQNIVLDRQFAVSKFPVTFDDWDACVSVGGCSPVSDYGRGRGTKPVVRVSWIDAQNYIKWLFAMTGQKYRLLSEAEWEYAARAGNSTAFSWGAQIGLGNANCANCTSQWGGKQTSPVGSFKANGFGLFDMHGNVSQWVEDCYQNSHNGAAIDGSPRTSDCGLRTIRGGDWGSSWFRIRSASRASYTEDQRNLGVGFRVGRTLLPVLNIVKDAPMEQAGLSSHSPSSSAAGPNPQVPDSSTATSDAPIRDVLLNLLSAVAQNMTAKNREEQINRYLVSPRNKALAANPAYSSWRHTGSGSSQMAEESALEGCQVRYGSPCVLIAVNDTVRGSAVGTNELRSGPRRTEWVRSGLLSGRRAA